MKEWVDHLIEAAMAVHAEDIHLAPKKSGYHIYWRVAGQLIPYDDLDLELGERAIRYLKYRANMDVGEHRLPQDGSLALTLPAGKIELRLSTIANYRLQESLVIRLLYANPAESLVGEIETEQWQILFDYCQRKSGLLIFSGPVSSGKTTTIYRLLSALVADHPYSILTMEDPVEIKDERFLQTEVNEAAGVTYECLIRASLRHHPDILVIGEIRDEETARMVMRAALTGHLVIATVHAKDCFGVIGRLEELGATREQLLQTLLLVVSQRLLPRSDGTGRVAIFERLADHQLQQILIDHMIPRDFQSLNTLIKEAYQRGLISALTAKSYQVESTLALRTHDKLDDRTSRTGIAHGE